MEKKRKERMGRYGVIRLTGGRPDGYHGLLEAARGAITLADATRVFDSVRLDIQIAGNLAADAVDANLTQAPVAAGPVDDFRLQRGHHARRLAQAVKTARILRGPQI